MFKLAIIDKNPLARLSQWRAAPDPKKFFHKDSTLVNDISKYDPDFIFINKGNVFTNIATAILGHKSIYFYGDYYRPIPQYVKGYAAMCDTIILTNKDKELWKSLPNKNIHFVSQGVDTDIFKPIEIEKKYDILFGGNYLGPKFCGSNIRMELVQHIKNMGFNFCIIGDGWPTDIETIPWQPAKEYNALINQARVTVGMSHFIDVPYYTSNRLYQMMVTGVPHIAWHSPGVGNLFKKGYCEADNYYQLDNLIDFYISNKTERDKKGIEQRQEILRNHTIHHAWNRIEKIMESL